MATVNAGGILSFPPMVGGGPRRIIAGWTGPLYHHAMRPLGLALLCALLLTSDLSSQEAPYTVDVRDGVITISVPDGGGIPMKDFVKIAQRVTGKLFTFTPQELEGVSVRFIGTARVAQARFFGFFQTMAYIKGFACVLRGEGGHEVVELIKM